MPCNIKPVEGLKEPADCKCYGAVMNAYAGMVRAKCPESVAREVAQRVYTYHHPEDPKEKASLTVERWLYAGHAH